jgi:PAS domain S-box-containing protein
VSSQASQTVATGPLVPELGNAQPVLQGRIFPTVANQAEMSAALSQAIVTLCTRYADAVQLLEALAGQVRQWFGCLAVGVFSQRFDTTPAAADSPLLPLAVSPQEQVATDSDLLEQMFAAATLAVVQLAPYHRPLHEDTLSSSSHAAEGGYHLLALLLEAAGAPAGVMVLVSAGAALIEDQVALLEAVRPALALAFSYALNRKIGDQARRKQEQLEAIFTTSSEGMLTVDAGYRILELNPAFAAVTGWPSQEALGRTCMEVLQCRDERDTPLCKTERCPLQQVFTHQQPIPYYEVALRDRQGHKKEIAASFTAGQAPDGLRGVIIARDMTLLNAANRMRSNFISMVSHELRTPLNTINGFLSIVLEEHVGSLNERQREFLGYVRSSADQLITLVNDILFISRADTGRFALRCAELDLPDLLAQVIRDASPAAGKLEVALHRRVSRRLPKLLADAGRLHQVLMNLIHNALKFTPPGGSITLSARRAGEMAEISVADTGCGVPFEDQPRVFERFYQSENALLIKHGGFGLGLTIAKLIVEQHGGRIWLQSEPERGSTFRFTIPLLH